MAVNHGAQEGDSEKPYVIDALNAFGEILREKRLAQGMSEGELADMCNIPVSDVRSWESGKDCPLGGMVLLCAVLRTDVCSLCREISERLDPTRVDVDPDRGTYQEFWRIVQGMGGDFMW